jgi:uncharacterized protein YceH (UPF0502 family)
MDNTGTDNRVVEDNNRVGNNRVGDMGHHHIKMSLINSLQVLLKTDQTTKMAINVEERTSKMESISDTIEIPKGAGQLPSVIA